MYLAGASLPTVGRGKRAGIRVISDTGNHTRIRRQPQCDFRIDGNRPDYAQSQPRQPPRSVGLSCFDEPSH